MKTAGDFVRKALRLLRVIGEGVEVSAEQMTDGLECLHDMLCEWSGNGVRFAPPQTRPNQADIVRVSDSWNNAISYNLAVDYAAEFGIGVANEVRQKAMTTASMVKTQSWKPARSTAPKWLTGLNTYAHGEAEGNPQVIYMGGGEGVIYFEGPSI